ncbi:MAG: hypothetical protein ICV60_09055 [Pyrinomonadaceae bacterium]|nr:hypothetical protein [Pyrinomonadaceae bacterium]
MNLTGGAIVYTVAPSNINVSETSGEQLMRNRSCAVRGARPNARRRRRRLLSRFSLIIFLFAGLFAAGWLSDVMRAAGDGAATVQLVRLVLTAEDGAARVEIVADSALDENSIQRFSRAGETVVRVRGARSLLRATYSASDIVARTVRTYSGEANGEPYVDIVISFAEGDAVLPRRNFNRLVIGITNEVARARVRAARAAEAQARLDPSSPRSVSIDSAPVTDAIPSSATRSTVAAARGANSAPAVATSRTTSSTSAQQAQAVNDTAPLTTVITTPIGASNALVSTIQVPAVSAQEPPFTFRGRTLWLASAFGSRMIPVDPGAVRIFSWNGSTYAAVPDLSGGWLYVPMTLEAQGRVPGQWVPGTTAAVRDEIGGHPFGPGVLRPSVLLGGMFDDNFFYRSAAGENVGLFTLAPRLEYEIPGDRRALRMMYEARIGRLSNGNWVNGQTFDLDTRANLGRWVRLAFRNHLVRSTLDPREFDPAGEVYIVGDTFTRNDGAVRAEFLLSPRSRLSLGTGYNIVDWDEDYIQGAPLFINYNELYTDVDYERDISESTTALVSASFTNTNSTAPLRPQFNRLSANYRYQFQVGARMQITETNGLAFRAGYERSDFRHAPEDNDYNTLIFDLLYRRDLSDRINFEAAALRKTQVSSFNLEGGNARLLSTGARARVEGRATGDLKLGFGLDYQQLSFPIAVVPGTTASGGIQLGQFAGERRKDHLYGFSFDAAYQLSELVRSRFVYSFSRRDSTLPVLTFNRNRVSLVFEFGRRNDTRGRPF